MAYKCKTFEAVNLMLHVHYIRVSTVAKAIGTNTENKICLPKKEYIDVH